jgi:hypothetical protein
MFLPLWLDIPVALSVVAAFVGLLIHSKARNWKEQLCELYANTAALKHKRSKMAEEVAHTATLYTDHERSMLEIIMRRPILMTDFTIMQMGSVRQTTVNTSTPDVTLSGRIKVILDEFKSIDERVVSSREKFNDIAKQYNASLQSFPDRWILRERTFPRAKYLSDDLTIDIDSDSPFESPNKPNAA